MRPAGSTHSPAEAGDRPTVTVVMALDNAGNAFVLNRTVDGKPSRLEALQLAMGFRNEATRLTDLALAPKS